VCVPPVLPTPTRPSPITKWSQGKAPLNDGTHTLILNTSGNWAGVSDELKGIFQLLLRQPASFGKLGPQIMAKIDKYLNLAYFAVDRRYHRRGLGTSLIRELFKSATLVSCYVGIEMLYLESVDEAVSFYRSVGFQLVKPNLTPEKYHAELQDTTNINFDMFITIEDLFKKGYVPPERNVVSVLLSERD
jgi:GNAT superfamily N-acetyltransferase